jgi:hypothetical protein
MNFWRIVFMTVMLLSCVAPASAQTQGSRRRGAARNVQQACKAGDEKSRPECRQMKRQARQAARSGELPNPNARPTP